MRIILFILKFLSWPLNWLPRRSAHQLGVSIGRACYRWMPRRREVALHNLQLAYGSKLGDAEAARLVRQNFEHYGLTLVEIVRAATWKNERFRQEVDLQGFEHYEQARQRGQGGIFLTSHLGNWELAIAVAASTGMEFDVVVKRAKSPQLDTVLQWYRTRTGAGVLAETGTAKDILKSLSRGRFVVFVFDQFMGPPIGLPVSFFGKPAGTAAALALITEKRDVPILPVHSYRDPDGRLHTVISPPLQLPALPEEKEARLFTKTQFYNDVLEEQVRRYPEQWIWIHRRWKEYRGEPRWKPRTALTGAVVAFAILCAGCATTGGSQTGIALPPDPTIEAPTIRTVDKPEETMEEGVQVELKPESAPATPAPEVVDAKPKRKEKPKKKKKAEAPPAPAAAVNAGGTSIVQVANVHKIPFEVGERMKIDLTWMGLLAGTATLEVRPGPVIAGRPTTLLWGNAVSSRLVDPIYKIDNTIESYIDAQGLFPYKFLLHMVETHQNKETRVAFDHPKSKAYYWAKRISKKWGNQDADRADTIVPLTKDMWSALYYARAVNYELNKKVAIPVYENGQNLVAELTPVANELVHTKVGVFQCWKINLQLKLNNVLRPSGDLYLWLSDDSKRYIAKFDVKLQLGSLYGYLSELKEK